MSAEKSRAPKQPTETPAPSQLPALLKRWEESLALHARYVDLDESRYRHVQPWPKHERPARWILDLARQKLKQLTRVVEKRSAEGDQTFLEALELMRFLATLVGLSNVERFVPLCDASDERREVLNAPPAQGARSAVEDHTREMPQLGAGQIGRMLLAQRAGVPYVAAAEPRRALPKKRSGDTANTQVRPARTSTAKTAAAPTRGAEPSDVEMLIVADALRLLAWGRLWHELPEIIARLADRPPLPHIRRALREQRILIERRHGAALA